MHRKSEDLVASFRENASCWLSEKCEKNISHFLPADRRRLFIASCVLKQGDKHLLVMWQQKYKMKWWVSKYAGENVKEVQSDCGNVIKTEGWSSSFPFSFTEKISSHGSFSVYFGYWRIVGGTTTEIFTWDLEIDRDLSKQSLAVFTGKMLKTTEF